jgi:arylsulfatase A-like enzyme
MADAKKSNTADAKNDKDDATEQPRWGRVGRQHAAGTPFFVWLNTTHMHCRTHTKPSSLGQAGPNQSPYHDTMIDHDKNVGEMLDLLDELKIADNTLVLYFPPRQKAASFIIDQAIEKMETALSRD